MANIALNKFADASNSMFPYQPARADDGVVTPLNRWVGSSPIPLSGTPAPVWLRVDLGANCWINRWVVKQMGAVGWSPNYNLSDYKLQGSLDNVNWFDIDSVVNNSANQTDRSITPTKVRWARIYVTKGLRCNTNFASVVDLELYPADPTSAKLSGLTISSGTLEPPFSSTKFAYTANVGYDTSSITVTPTVEDSRATVKVNGVPVASGQPSVPISLEVGSNPPITVEVTPFIGDPQNYTIAVTRASNPYLSTLVLKLGKNTLPLDPTFSSTHLNYSANIPSVPITISVIPTVQESGATIKINNVTAPSGQSTPISITSSPSVMTIIVTSADNLDSKPYTVNFSIH